IGTIFRIIQTGENGFLVDNHKDWVAVLSDLILDENLRQRIGHKAAETVESHYSLNTNKERYLNILNSVVN
ncbi:MAG TPA: glycosyltransferase, partial [Flavisolibacter sp.]|nr:glycosyltransferase [Flavisolibacter sp.]